MTNQTMGYGDIQSLIKKKLLEDKIKLAGTNYSPYPGKTLSPMSSLTQRAQALDERRAVKGIPYGKSLNILANKESEGIKQPDLQSLLDILSNKQRGLTQDITGNRLDKQFGAGFDPYRNKYHSKFQKDAGLHLKNTAVDLDNINNDVKNLEKTNRYRDAFSGLVNSSINKQNRHKNLTDNLHEFGTQKHGINNKLLTAEQARFNAERNEPYDRLANLQRAAGSIDMEEEHPDVLQHNANQLQKALSAYDMKTPTYQGKLVEPINADLASSYSLLEEISPKYQDKNYHARKQLRKSIVNDPSTISKFIQTKLPGNLDPKFALVDQEAKQKAKNDMTALNAKYIKQGMYGSQAHMKDAANRMREINKATFDSNSKTMKNELMGGVTRAHNDNINNVLKLGQYDQLANSEFNHMLGDIKRTNTTGLEKWKNDQLGNEQLYKAYQNEKNYQQPRLLANARATGADMGIGGMFNHFSNQGIDLNSISDLQNRYDNLERELSTARDKIKNQNDYNLQRTLIQEQEKRLAAERTRQAQIDAQNRQRLEDERKKQIQNANLQITPNYQNLINQISGIHLGDMGHNQGLPYDSNLTNTYKQLKQQLVNAGYKIDHVPVGNGHNGYYPRVTKSAPSNNLARLFSKSMSNVR